MQFQPTIPPFLSGTISASVASPGLPPTTIFAPFTPFSVTVNVTLAGTLVLLLAGSTFHIRVRIEPIGPDPSSVNGPVDVIVSATGTVPPAVVSVAGGLPEGAYILVALLTATNSGGTPIPVAAFSDEIMIQTAPGA